MIAAQVVAKAQENESANDDVQPLAEEAPAVAAAAPTAAPASAPAVNVKPVPPSSKLDVSAAQRLATVRALNEKSAPAPAPSQTTAPAAELPQSFEEQINTSMTATLKALNVSQQPVNDDDDDDDEGGFLGLVRRS